VPGSAVLSRVKDLPVQLDANRSRKGEGVRCEAESDGPEANHQAAAEAVEARRTGRREPLEARLC